MMTETTQGNGDAGQTLAPVSLLACPFCGETPELTKHFKHEMWQLIHRCEVMPTMVIDWRDTPQQIAERWNTRKQANDPSSATASAARVERKEDVR